MDVEWETTKSLLYFPPQPLASSSASFCTSEDIRSLQSSLRPAKLSSLVSPDVRVRSSSYFNCGVPDVFHLNFPAPTARSIADWPSFTWAVITALAAITGTSKLAWFCTFTSCLSENGFRLCNRFRQSRYSFQCMFHLCVKPSFFQVTSVSPCQLWRCFTVQLQIQGCPASRPNVNSNCPIPAFHCSVSWQLHNTPGNPRTK